VTNQHLDSVRDNFHLHVFSHIGEELLEVGKQSPGVVSKKLLEPAHIPELIEDLSDVIPRAIGKNATRRKQMKSSARDEE
jgi:hypothetical protein